MKWWRIEKKLGYEKSLNQLGVNKDLINYLTNYIPFVINENDHIYVCYDEKRNNRWNIDWIWQFKLELEEGDIYYGVFNIKEERKRKLKNIENERIYSE